MDNIKIPDSEQNSPQQRWDPFLKEWVIYSPKRSKRPFQGKKFKKEPKKTWTCPFCPDAPEGAGEWIVKQLPNKYSSLDENAEPFIEKIFGKKKYASNYGKCEVILYSQDHNSSFGTLTVENIVALINLWKERYIALSEMEELKYIFIMENRGKEIGNSMTHPHGQIYSFPYIPKKIEKEFDAFKDYHDTKGKCLMCGIIYEELKDESRIVEENESFIAEVPYYAHWAFEIHIIAKNHISSIDELSEIEVENLAKIMKKIVQCYDKLYDTGKTGKIMPYIMAMHNAPENVEGRDKWHFHIEYYTPFRGENKIKFLAGVELGTGIYISDHLPEYSAKIMRSFKI